MKELLQGPNKSMWMRMLAVLLVVCIGMFGTTGYRLVKLMIFDSQFYQEKAIEQQLSDVEIVPPRGDIYDRTMGLMASSTTVYTAYIVPSRLKNDNEKDKALVKEGLISILGLSEEDAEKAVNKSNGYEIVKRQVEEPMMKDMRRYIKDNDLGSYAGLDVSSKRNYPEGNLASSVLGFVGQDNQGLEGLEKKYDSELSGVPGRVVAIKNGVGAEMPFTYEKMVDAQPGNSVVLTIDKYIQHVTEKYLEQAVIETSVKERACIIVMDVNTGGVLAMATKSDFDPNNPFEIYDEKIRNAVNAMPETTEAEIKAKSDAKAEARLKQWRNKAVVDTYEPGSVYKIVTGSAAFEEKVATMGSTYNCSGSIKVGDRTISCANKNGHGHQTIGEAFQHSCNPAFITMGLALGGTAYFKYFSAFGLTKKTGIDLPGEMSPIYHSESNLKKPVELATTSFGQTFKVTPIQMITAISAAVNGGTLYTPHVVSKILDTNKNVVRTIEPEAKRQVISKETSDFIRSMMEQIVSVEGASGRNAYIAGYHIGGKTGTSEKRDTEDANDRISSFCGVAPMNNPQVAVLVMLDDPQTTIKYGGTLAAPVARSILGEILPYLGVSPDYTEAELAKLDVTISNVVGMTVEKAKTDLTNAGLKVKIEGDGAEVERQVPAVGEHVSKGASVVLYTKTDSQTKTTTVPKLTGLTVAGVNSEGVDAGINIQFSGGALNSPGAVSVKQSIAEGTKVEIGTIVTVDFVINSNVE